MTDITEDEAPPKKSKLPLILGLVLALAGGGGGFFAVSSGMLGSSGDADHTESSEDAKQVEDIPKVAFVALDPMVISLPAGGVSTHLRFAAQLEVTPEHAAEVEALKPRVIDVLNGYLRAVELSELGDPAILVKLRGQMLRRVQVVVGDGRVRDLLIMEFVLN
ncbi:flagellar FliL protein [Cognatiyoonia koreensis]|uniref:Flagellar protein FliL n=1 Tax=Cognatiyoonia koreensis TaxID=364200 RepID=A0A1I0RKJ6_9RHOB|nr:flagellar basal body-associated FliL family protein [Cognatiyoonia koreensis]SEW41365.1 flagellar FliL protein [Cognatiyoonia koreensis]